MRKYKLNNLAMAATALAILWLLSVACGNSTPKPPQSNADVNSTPKIYQSKEDGFSIEFPFGTDSNAPEAQDFGNGIVERRHAAKSNDATYEVFAAHLSKKLVTDLSAQEILEDGAKREDGKILDKQKSTFQGKEAIIIKSEFSGSPGSNFVKSVILFDAAKDTLFAIRAGGKDKEFLDSKTVNDFINSFKLEK